jgi:hypothetical protein
MTRYSLVGGCYQVASARRGNRSVPAPDHSGCRPRRSGRICSTAYATSSGGSTVTTAPAPSAAALWRVDGGRGAFTITNEGTGATAPVMFTPASGCAVYPEAGVDATGTPFTGATPESTVTGTIDAHTHVTAFEFPGGQFHCGRPWSPFGAPYALPDCAPYEKGTNGQIESFLDYGAPAHAHDTRGWPTFHDWPGPTQLAEEGDYYTGIKRAWMAGLRVMVTQLVDNEALCTLMTSRTNPCNDMASVHLQAGDLRRLQDDVDAQSGGPGKGFFRIVTDPFQARRVVNQGKLAVVEGIEVSHLFDCGEYLGVPLCNRAQIDAGLNEVRALGVSTFFPIHKFDNAFGGTKMDSGELGVLVNLGNHLETGSFWNIQTCTGPEHDSEQITPLGGVGALSSLLDGPVGSILGGVVPVYTPAPHCNTRDLTDLGAYLIDKMIQEHFIVELDHMDARTADAALSIIEAHHYSGVVSAHSWDSPEENPRIYDVGGFVTPIAGASPGAFVAQWRASEKIRNPRFYAGTGFGYGADMNGLAEESQPTAGNPIGYPFRSYDGRVTFTREQWGQRVFDINRDGVANYGMFADWLQELQVLAGRPIIAHMFHGAEAYLEMWERAYGVPPTVCAQAAGGLGASGRGPLRLGAANESILYAAGQSSSRPGSAYRYCVSGHPGATLTVVFSARGKAVAVGGNRPGLRAGSVAVGARAAALEHLASSLGRGLWLGRGLRGGARYVHGVHAGRVAFAAVVARARPGSGALAAAFR